MQKINLPVVSIELKKDRDLFSDVAMDSPEAAIEIMDEFFESQDRELFCIVNLQNDFRPISMNVVSMGTLDESVVHPREVFKSAILSNAAYIMLFHNHPSGCLKLSDADIQTTDRLVQCGQLLGIQVVDHIIVGEDHQVFSFQKEGILKTSELSYSKDTKEVSEKLPKIDLPQKRESDNSEICTELLDLGLDPFSIFVKMNQIQFYRNKEKERKAPREDGIIDDTYY